jgi:TonB-linked SusC/RagA family outer membrane protein
MTKIIPFLLFFNKFFVKLHLIYNLNLMNMRLKLSILSGFFLLLVQFSVAQKNSVSGQIMDDKGAGVPFVTVTEKGTSNSVKADANGFFKININPKSSLVLSATGYEPKTYDASSGFTSFSLKEKVGVLSEVVVTTSLGIQRQAKDLGYSTAKVKANELTQAKTVNLQNGLTGKVSGLTVSTTNNGVIGDNVRLTLRGIRSLTGNNQPMLIVDGVPISLGFLSSINPNDIQDVSILKSGSATAFYGSDGINGAIVVTTKKGSKLKPVITLSHTTQRENVSYLPKFQTRFGGGYSPDELGYGTFEPIEQQSWGDEFDGSIRQFGQTGPNGEKLEMPYSNNKNGRKNFFVTGVTNQTDVSYSNGDFYLSAQNVDISGTLEGDKSKRTSVTLKSEKEYKKFKAGYTMRYTKSKYDVTSNNQAIYYNVTGSPGNYDLSRFRDWRNDWFSSPDGYYTTYLDGAGKTPYFAKDNYRTNGTTEDFFGNAQLDFKAASWLTFTYRVGLTYSGGNSNSTVGAFNYSAFHNTLRDHGSSNITASVSDASFNSKRLTSELFAKFNQSFGKFGINAIAGQSFREASSAYIGVGSSNLGNSTLLSLQMRKGEPNASESSSKSRLERYFGSVGVDYNNWAFLEGTGSYDFDSRLAKPGVYAAKNDVGFFYPGVNASFVLSEAIGAIKKSSVISFLKVRGAIAKTGNVTVSPYAFENTFSASTFFPYGDVLSFAPNASTAAVSYNPEYVLNREVGLELGLLNNRINVEATYFNQDNSNQIINVQLSNTTGYTSARQNAGEFTNKGIELDLKLTPLVKIGKANIDFKVNYTNLTSEVTSLIDGVDELGIGNYNYAIVGMPAYVFKMTDYVRDPLGRVIVDKSTGMPEQNPSLTTFGRTSPEHLLGLNLNANWKGFSFGVVADYRGGYQIVADQLGGFLDDNGISARSAQFGRRAFVFPNSVYDDGNGNYVENTNVFTQQYGRMFWNSELNTTVTTNYLASGSFWKLREVSLSYEIPVNKLGSKIASTIKGASVTLSGRNLLMWVPSSNQWTDPEFVGGNGNSSYTGNATGRSTAAQFPPTRTFGATLSLRF